MRCLITNPNKFAHVEFNTGLTQVFHALKTFMQDTILNSIDVDNSYQVHSLQCGFIGYFSAVSFKSAQVWLYQIAAVWAIAVSAAFQKINL